MVKGDKVIINGKQAVIKKVSKDKVLAEICVVNDKGIREKRLQWYAKDLVSDVYLNNTKGKNVEFGVVENAPELKEEGLKNSKKKMSKKTAKSQVVQTVEKKKDDASNEKV